MKKKTRILNQKGQSTVEFVLTFIMLFSFVLFFNQLSLVFAFGNYVHYATFMAARAYLSASSDRGDQKARAKDVIVRMLKKSVGQAGIDKFPSIAKGVGPGDPGGFQSDPPSQYNPTDIHFSWMEGVRYTFKSRLFILPFGRVSSGDPNINSVTLTSESWLGREPNDDECRSDMGTNLWFYDNGC